MNVNKKLDRFKQWAGERMGGEVKTNVSDDFKALEVEMGLRYEGRWRVTFFRHWGPAVACWPRRSQPLKMDRDGETSKVNEYLHEVHIQTSRD